MSSRLKYKPKHYKRLAEIAQWLADGKNVQFCRTGRAAELSGSQWFQFTGGSIESLIDYGCEFRIKPSKEQKQ